MTSGARPPGAGARPPYRSGLRELWDDGHGAIGGWLALGSPFAAELLAAQRLDYLVIDCQHGLVGHEAMVAILGVISRMRPVPLVRVPSNDHVWIARALDAGAEGVIVPMVSSRAEAAAAVSACRFPPVGTRSYGPIRGRRQLGYDPERMNEGVLCFAMVETGAGLDSVDEICGVPGLDGLYVGPADLGIALGVPPRRGLADPAVRDAIRRIRLSCERNSLVSGVHAVNGAQAHGLLAEGFSMVTTIADTDALRLGAATEVAAARGGPA